DAPVDLDDLASRDTRRLADRPPVAALADAPAQPTLADLTALAAAGARIDELAALVTDGPVSLLPLPGRRDAAPFEALRALAPTPPTVLLAPIGSVASTVNIVTWARNFFAAGGIEAVVPGDGGDPVERQEADGYAVAVLCPGRGVDDESTSAMAEALRKAGADRILLAMGKDDRAQGVGADAAVRDGQDMAVVLADLHRYLDAGQDA
ncbi:MAG: hypothetical protein REI11_21050, partial [Patulibacter sp.]|nr:hypothetical protein [Patulibacter sp.]